MTEQDPQQDRNEAYRQAREEEAAAAARARALRPWYRKKRYIFGGPLAGLIVIAVIAAIAGGDDDDTTFTPSSDGRTSAATESSSGDPPGIGDLVEVGSLDLAVLDVNTSFDAAQYNQFNEANVAIRFRATNARGDADEEYNLNTFLFFQVVDSNGVAHDPATCAGCPDDVGNVDLVRGGMIEGTVHFEIPEGVRLVELIYEPIFSRNKARIRLR